MDPSKQCKGAGSQLIKESIKRAKELNYKVIVILGYPKFYARFGFQNGKQFAVHMENHYPCGLMVLELEEGVIAKFGGGEFDECGLYATNADEVQEFDKAFPVKEKFKTKSQKAHAITIALSSDDPIPEYVEQNTWNKERLEEE